MTEEEKTANLPSDVTDFLGMGQERTGGYGAFVRPPSFAGGTDEFDDQTKKERRARFKASADMLFSTDVSKLDDAGASALYQSVTEGLFGLPDEDGSVAFGKRASKDPRANIDMLRKFVKGDYTLIEDPEYTKWRQMDDEAKFKYAHEQETAVNSLRSTFKGERGPSVLELFTHALSPAPLKFGALRTETERETQRKMRYEDLTDEEKAAYRADVIGDYEEKLSRRQTLATFLQFAHGLSDRAGYLLAKSFSDGTPDGNIEGLPEDERDRVYAAFSLMRGDQKKGRILGIQTDFTDDTAVNRFQLGLYGFQQSVAGLVTDTGEMVRDFGTWGLAKAGIDISRITAADIAMFRYSHAIMDEAERKEFFKGWDANVRAEQAMKQELPEASGFFGEAFQGLAENAHWFIPYGAIRKGGSLVKGARAAVARAGLQKEVAEGGLTLAKAAAEASRTRWLADVEGAVKAGKGAKKISEFSSAIAMRRQLAAVEQYTAALREIPNVVRAAKWKDAAGAGMWAAGEASAFSAFASEYVANADAAGISREESVLTAAAIGLINAKIEQLYVPGLESSLSPAQIKSLTFAAMAQAIKTDGAAGFRKWLANRVSKGVTEGVKVTLTEGAVEEPLQQMAIEHGKAFDKLCGELRENGQATLANEAKALWDSFARTLPNDYATFIDTAADMVPSSLGFGVRAVGAAKLSQHVRNTWARIVNRHAARRTGTTSTMMTAQTMQELQGATDYDAGLVDVIQQAVNVRAAVEKHWQGEEDGGEAKNPHRFEEAITAARRAWRDPQTGDAVQEIADAAGVDVKTAEVLAQYLQTEAEAAAFSPQARAWTSLNMSLADIDEATIKTVLPGYVEGSFASDPENGIYSGRVRMDDGTEKTIAYRVGDFSDELRAEADENAKIGSAFGDSFNERHEEMGDGIRWETLSDAQRYQEALFASNAARMGSGVFELTDSKGRKVRVNADSVIRLANGHIADIGYGPAATQATVRHETFHSLWQFVRGTLADEDVQQLAKTLGIDVTADNWERKLDERMAHEMERYASGHYVSHAVSSRFDKMLDSWAGKIINFFGQFGPSDEVTDPKTGKPYQLKGLYDSILRGELGSGALGVELRKVKSGGVESGGVSTPIPNAPAPNSSRMPVEVTDADRAEAEAAMRKEDEGTQETEETEKTSAVAPVPSVSPVASATAENPADASVPNQRFYKVGLPNSPVKLVGRLEVRDAESGVITSTDADYHDRGNQNRDDRSEESRALVEKIGANPDPLQIGTVQPIANNGIVWLLNNSNVIIGNHRVNGVRLGYEKGTAGELEKFVREDAAKRGIEIGADVKKPLMVFVLERIESPDGKADVHEVVRLANESQNRGFNIREQAGNDAKILIDNNLLPRMEFRADGRIDETKSGDAIGKFRQESGAQGLIAEDGSLTEEGQTRIQNAALAVLLGGEGNNALLNKIMTNAGRLDMQGELRALMKMTPELMALAESKPTYDLRAPLAEALQLFTEWRDKDESARVEKGKTRHDWRETKDGRRVRGLSWEAFMSQGDMFRAPSDEAKILGDLFAKAESLRSFDREDVESAAGKKRVIDLISDYLTDYIKNARAVNTETDDMFGGTPATRAEVMAAQRATGGEGGGPRFSVTVNPHLKDDVEAALVTHSNGVGNAKPLSRRQDVVMSEDLPLFGAIGLPDMKVVCDPAHLRKINDEHLLTLEQIVELPTRYNDPAIVFRDGDKAFVVVTDMVAPNKAGGGKSVMVRLTEQTKKSGERLFLASAYSREAEKESEYIRLANTPGAAVYCNKDKVAALMLEQGTKSTLQSLASRDDVVTPEGLTAQIIPQSGSPAQGGRSFNVVTPEQDAAQRARPMPEGGPRFSIDGTYKPRSNVPAVRGGWNEKKILRYLKANPSLHGVRTAARLISEFDTVDELKDHMFYHGTRNYVDKMQPSMTQSERWAQEHGGGGYGQRYWGISVSKSKKVASNFGNPSPGVSIYPVVLAKGAKVIDRPDLPDAADVEDHIVELWNDGVDAVRLGDWSEDTSEQELLVLNPRAICNIGTEDSYRYFKLGSDENPLDIKDDAHIARMLEAAKEYAEYSPSKRFGKPLRPSLFYPRGEDGAPGEMKPREVIEAEKAQYEKDLAAWQQSEQGISAAEYEWKMRDAIRFSIDTSHLSETEKQNLQAAQPAGRNKAANGSYPDAGEEISSMRFSIGAKRREEYSRLLAKHRPDLRADAILDELDKYDNPKKEKLALHWIVRGTIWLPNDESKVDQAIEVAEKAKVDPFKYASPLALIDAHSDIHPTEKRIDPATVPELTDARDEGEGVVSYEVADSREGQSAIRRIIDTHWGKEANPWCLLARDTRDPELSSDFWKWMRAINGGRGEDAVTRARDKYFESPDEFESQYKRVTGRDPRENPDELTVAWGYWQKYNALPKRVAFKDGKLLAFMATEGMDNVEVAFLQEHPEIKQEYLTYAENNGINLDPVSIDDSDFFEPHANENIGLNTDEWIGQFHREEYLAYKKRYHQEMSPEEWWDRQDESHIGHDGLMEIAGGEGGGRFSIAGGSALATAKLGEWKRDVDEDSVRTAIADYIDRGAMSGNIKLGSEGEKLKIAIAANQFFKAYSDKIVMLSDGRCAYFAPDQKNRERGLSNAECWAIYCVHAVTHGGKMVKGKQWNERIWSPEKAESMMLIEKALKEERCIPQLDWKDRTRDRVVFAGESANGERMNIVTRLDEYGNINADLTEVTVVMEGGKTPPANYRPLTEAVEVVAIHQADGYSVSTAGIISNSVTEHKEQQQAFSEDGRYSIEAPRSALVYPQLRGMRDDDLLAVAIAARIALGKSDKVSDKSVKINTVQRYMRRLHPDWDTTKIGVESQRVMSGAQKFAKRIREDLDRGVSDSLVLKHLPTTMREQFGSEMRQEAREGARMGAFGVRANAALEERQARLVEDAVRVQTGLDAGAIENAFGINLSETIMHLVDNPLTEKDAPPAAGTGEDVSGPSASADESEEPAAAIDAKVKAVVDDIVTAAGQQAGADERNRQERRAAAGRDAENEAAMGGEEGSEGEGDSSGEGFEGDALAEAVKKSALDLENPRHLARFVAELARRQWIKEHQLAQDAEVWRDLVAVQFLRKTAQSVYAKLCRDLVYSRSRETAMQRIARLDAVPTVAGLLSEMEFVGALINAQRIRDTQKQLCEKLDLFLRQNFGAQGRFKPDKEEGKRKVSAEAELRARYMRHAMWFTPDAAAEEARRLQETLDALSVDFKEAGRDRDQSREFVETIRKLNVLREFGALRYKPVGEIESAAQWWEDFARGESDDIVREMSDRDIRTKKAAHLLAVAFADPRRTTIREGGKADALNRFITGHMGFISLLQDCMRHASDADAAAVKDIIDYISREIQKSGDRSEAEKRRHNDAFHAAVESIYGKGFNAVMKDMMAPDERFTKYMGVVGGKRVTPTKGRALQLLVSLLQEGRKVQVEDEDNPGQTKTVWEGGYHDNIVKHKREGQAAEIMRLLDPADMNMLKWLGQWYESNRSDLSGVCHSLFGIGVYAELPNYFPVKMMLETQGLEKGQGVGWTIFPKALTPRVRNERDFDTSADIFSMWASRMEEAAQWKHHAQLGLELRGIFGRSELREAVRANHGASVDELMQGFITDILAGHGAYDRSTAGFQYFSDQIRGWTALCALGGNVGVMAKQTTSIPAFGFEIGLVNTAKYMVSAFTPEGMSAMAKIWDSEQRRTRWNLGSSEAVKNALAEPVVPKIKVRDIGSTLRLAANGSSAALGALKKLLQASMITNKIGDVIPGLVVGQGIYRDCLARGMSEEDAMAETWSIVERTQQSGRMENQTSIQRRNKLGRIMFQFLSTQQQYLQYEVRAIREVIARPDSVKRWGSLGRAILLNHFILSSAYYWMGQLYKYALGQEPPEDELKDWIVTCLLGPYGSLFVAGFCCKYTLERAIKGYSIKGGSSMLPMESWLKNQVNDGAKLLEAIFDSDGDTWDNMLEAAGRWMSDSNSTVRDLRKIYRYRIKGEPQK